MAELYVILFVLTVGLLFIVWLSRSLQPSQTQPTAAKTTRQRLLKPRTPDDCQACRQGKAEPAIERQTRAVILPWSEIRSRRGAPKHIDTQGYACDNPACVYFGITDSQLHALVGDGSHGKAERIQILHCVQGRLLRCQACGQTFSARRHTPLYRL